MVDFFNNLFKNITDLNYMTTNVNGITLVLLTIVGFIWGYFYKKEQGGIGTEWLISLAIVMLWFANIYNIGTTIN